MNVAVFIVIILSWIQLTQGVCKTYCYIFSTSTDSDSFYPDNVDPSLCEYLIIGYSIVVFSENPKLAIHPKAITFLERIQFYKQKNANLKVLLELTNYEEKRSSNFFLTLTSNSSINKFANNAKQLLLEKGLDGLSIRPLSKLGSSDYSILLNSFIHIMSSNFQTAIGGKRMYLFVSVAGAKYLYDYQLDFNFGGACRAVDKLILETHNLIASSLCSHPSRLYGDSEKGQISVNFVTNFVISKGCAKDKLVFTVSPLIYCFQHHLTYRDGSKEYLFLYNVVYPKFCPFLDKGVKVQRLSDSAPYVIGKVLEDLPDLLGTEFIYYFEDDVSLKAKVDYVKQKGLGGIMIWDIFKDDFKGTCRRETYPILRATKKECW